MATHCPICSVQLRGRSDKLFCSTKCKSIYHYQQKKTVITETAHIDRLLHKNYLILAELIPENLEQIKVSKKKLDQKNFQFQYLTGLEKSKSKIRCLRVYNLAWRKINQST